MGRILKTKSFIYKQLETQSMSDCAVSYNLCLRANCKTLRRVKSPFCHPLSPLRFGYPLGYVLVAAARTGKPVLAKVRQNHRFSPVVEFCNRLYQFKFSNTFLLRGGFHPSILGAAEVVQGTFRMYWAFFRPFVYEDIMYWVHHTQVQRAVIKNIIL